MSDVIDAEWEVVAQRTVPEEIAALRAALERTSRERDAALWRCAELERLLEQELARRRQPPLDGVLTIEQSVAAFVGAVLGMPIKTGASDAKREDHHGSRDRAGRVRGGGPGPVRGPRKRR